MGWFWFIPISPELTSVGVVLRRAVFDRLPRLEHEALLERCIADTPAAAELMRDARREWPVRVEKDFSYTASAYAGDRWLLAGDAGSFLDPVFSTGVTIALESGLEAARALDEGLRRGDLSRRRLPPLRAPPAPALPRLPPLRARLLHAELPRSLLPPGGGAHALRPRWSRWWPGAGGRRCGRRLLLALLLLPRLAAALRADRAAHAGAAAATPASRMAGMRRTRPPLPSASSASWSRACAWRACGRSRSATTSRSSARVSGSIRWTRSSWSWRWRRSSGSRSPATRSGARRFASARALAALVRALPQLDPEPPMSERGSRSPGVGAVSGFGWGAESLWRPGCAPAAPRCGDFDRFDHAGHRTHLAAQVPPAPSNGHRRAALADLFALAAAAEALAQAGLPDDLDAARRRRLLRQLDRRHARVRELLRGARPRRRDGARIGPLRVAAGQLLPATRWRAATA